MINAKDLEAFGYYNPPEKDLTPLQMFKEFSEAMGQEKDPVLYARLIEEEFDEWYEKSLSQWQKELVGELKELADLVYVTYGYANFRGWDLDEAVRRVHKSNMSKLGIDGKPVRRADGKILKSSNYREPSLEDLV